MARSTVAPSLTSLRDALDASGFTRPRVQEAASLVQYVPQAELRAPVALLQLRETSDQKLATLIAMFGFGEPVPRRELESLFPKLDLEGLAALELVELAPDGVLPLVRLTELDGLIFAYDIELERRRDVVVGISLSSLATAAYTPRVPVETALDLGTGCGVQALLAARHAERVIATDINPRALRLTSLNAELNGVANVETRLGNLFESAEGERFGLIVANLPYVISPDRRFLYRDAGLEGSTLCSRVLRELPDHLEDGGFATVEGNWPHAFEAPWWSPLELDLQSSGCDAYLIRRRTQDPLAYAVGWLSRPARDELDTHAETIRRWRESYAQAEIEAITTMVAILRRHGDTQHWCLALTEEASPRLELASALPALFAAPRRLAEISHSSLARELRPSPSLVVEQRFGVDGMRTATLECPCALGTRRAVSQVVADTRPSARGRTALARSARLPRLRRRLVGTRDALARTS
jgi:methylase of polypeptide subunit release factors